MKRVLFFTGANCVKCKEVHKFWNEVVEGNTMFNYTLIDTGKTLDEARKYKVLALPTFLVVDGEKELDRISGFVSKKLLEDFLRRNK